ncbi:DEKNAAC100857 [Brettanomyces naardenensis]|uniref:DEKNAAC100857 n=1 Tax=Brettanomyces naardenensis TaxID=13370 RepID=A0A448YEH2_BRENA|nr:DEKNAAC100857 [Brettanomyces naardenensis]
MSIRVEPEDFEGMNEGEIQDLARELTRMSTVASAASAVSEGHSQNSTGSTETTGEKIEEARGESTGQPGILAGEPAYTGPNDGFAARLMRSLSPQSTRLSQIQVDGISPFLGEDPRLNPDSSDFSAKRWVKNLRALQDQDVDYYKPYQMGVLYKDLRCYGGATDADYKTDCLNWVEKAFKLGLDTIRPSENVFDILKPMDGLIRPGTLTVVLGRPGAGCSTFLKTLASQTYGYHVDKKAVVTYEGLTPSEIASHYRGEVIYNAETEIHFPHLTVGQTLKFASLMKVPQNRPPGVSRDVYAEHMARVYMAMYGLSHTYNTKVGNEYVRGVSGGERKRVSIAEVSLCGAKLQCWDNSTRGLDSATAENFVRCLKLSSEVLDTTSIVSIYQCSQRTYDFFDTVILMYEGRQIFFGNTQAAKGFFERQGWHCPARQTTADFLTSLTSPSERIPRKGFENKVPRTAEEFEQQWKASPEYTSLREEIESYMVDMERDASKFKEQILASKRARQARHLRGSEPFTVSYNMQVRYLTRRAFQRIRNDFSLPGFTIFVNFLMALLNGSVFFNLQNTTADIYNRGACLFFACLFNSLMSLLEVFALYEARPIVEKHKEYGLYHPSAEAFASILSEIPTKLITSVAYNVTLYFMVNLKRTAGAFFFYFLVATTATFLMSHLFRSIGSSTKSLSQAMTPSAIVVLAMAVYAGFVVPTEFMLGWSRWINYINPIAYAFEAMMINEFHSREIECTTYVPQGGDYNQLPLTFKVCDSVGAVAGQPFVSGDRYIDMAFRYVHSHKWRNWGICIGFMLFFLGTYLFAVEISMSARQTGEKTLFLRSSMRKLKKQGKLGSRSRPHDPEMQLATRETVSAMLDSGETASAEEKNLVPRENSSSNSLSNSPAGNLAPSSPSSSDTIRLDSGTDVFHWRNVCYDIPYEGSTRRLLENVDGWVKPGTLTALMGASGAGKTTLLDVLADRVTMGVVSGDMLVNTKPRDRSFQRSTGYVQQQDLHLQTSTVRESLRFSAYLRQPQSVSKKEKDEYVENIIKVLEMENYADAVVGVPGEGLNVEQRKRLTIGVELVAKPKLLLFLDEPTSGLDSQTAWSILCLIRKLSNSGQAIMCTIHQPSAMLFSQFDNLLLLKSDGQTVYFGEIGKGAQTLIDYFESHGSIPCPRSGNPAEWMLEAIGSAPGAHPDRDWYGIWRQSEQYQSVSKELDRLQQLPDEKNEPIARRPSHGLSRVLTETESLCTAEGRSRQLEESSYASSIFTQYYYVTIRVFQQYWRSPNYIYSKLSLVVFCSLLNGFTFFKANNSIQGLQDQMFSIFMFTALFAVLVEQMLPHYVAQRSLYEVRERPSRTFSWVAFILAQITVEIPWMILCGTIAFLCFYFPVDFAHNAEITHDASVRGILLWLFVLEFYVWTSTLGQACIAGIEVDQNGANLATLLFSLSLLFCGVLVSKDKLPGFWIFMYRVSPFTYWIAGFLRAGVGNSAVTCAEDELLVLEPYPLQTCAEYLGPYMKVAGGYLLDPDGIDSCTYCKMANTDAYLSTINALEFTGWQDFGIFWVYVVANVFATIACYWLFRVPKKNDPVKWLGKMMTIRRSKKGPQNSTLS